MQMVNCCIFYKEPYNEDTGQGFLHHILVKTEFASNQIMVVLIVSSYGIGTISLIVSSKVKSVIGVELNKDAVKDAIKNAKRNKITNACFYNDDAGDFMVSLANEKQSIDVVFMIPLAAAATRSFCLP